MPERSAPVIATVPLESEYTPPEVIDAQPVMLPPVMVALPPDTETPMCDLPEPSAAAPEKVQLVTEQPPATITPTQLFAVLGEKVVPETVTRPEP